MITITLDKCLHEMGLSMNKLAVVSDTRPNTVIDIAKGKAQRIDFVTLDKLINGLNEIAISRGIERRFNVHDIIDYKYAGQSNFIFEFGSDDPDQVTGLYDTGLIELDDKK